MFSDLFQKLFGSSSTDTNTITSTILREGNDAQSSPSTPNHNLNRTRQDMQGSAARYDRFDTEQSQDSVRRPETRTARQTGSIRKLLATYGFIAGDDGVDYFLHWSGMDRRS